MPYSTDSRKHIFLVVFLALIAFSEPSLAVYHYTPLIRSMPSGQSASVQWPTNSINLSQLQSIFSQNPGMGMLNVQFPNQTSWGVTPAIMQTLTNTLQNEAQSMGLGDKLPDLVLSSLGGAGNGLSAGLPQLSIADLNPDTIKAQMDNVLNQLRYSKFALNDYLPDWLSGILMAIYDAVYRFFDFCGAQLASLVAR